MQTTAVYVRHPQRPAKLIFVRYITPEQRLAPARIDVPVVDIFAGVLADFKRTRQHSVQRRWRRPGFA